MNQLSKREQFAGLFSVSGTELDVCRDIEERQRMGIQKYGTTVAENPANLREWLQHAYEESLDKAIYLKRAIAEMERTAGVEESLTAETAPPENPTRYPFDLQRALAGE